MSRSCVPSYGTAPGSCAGWLRMLCIQPSDQLTPNLFANKSAAIIGFFSLAWHSPRLMSRAAAYVSAVPVLPRLAIFALKVMA